MKFYATPPSRARLSEDVTAFLSLLKFERDEQAEKMIISSAGVPSARALHGALTKARLTASLPDSSFEGPWREKLEDPLDRYSPDACREVRFLGTGEALLPVFWDRVPSPVVGRFRVEPRGAGFTLGFVGFDVGAAPAPAKPQPPGAPSDPLAPGKAGKGAAPGAAKRRPPPRRG